MWSDVSKVIQNNKLEFLHLGTLQQKQAIAGELRCVDFHGEKVKTWCEWDSNG